MEYPIWALVPAAGVGRRMGADVPKQYLPLGEGCVLEHTVARLRAHAAVRGVVISVAEDDPYFSTLAIAAQVERVAGGIERSDSVLNALNYVCAQGRGDDWAMVHDAVRPCVHSDDLTRLVEYSRKTGRGAILAAPVRDTMKQVEDGRITKTVERENLWHALTPQLFPVRALRDALRLAVTDGVSVTDEAQAMERVGQAPAVVQGRADNIKITRAEDLELAALFIRQANSADPAR